MLSIPFSGKHVRYFYHFYNVSHMSVPDVEKKKKSAARRAHDGCISIRVGNVKMTPPCYKYDASQRIRDSLLEAFHVFSKKDELFCCEQEKNP